MIDRKVKKAALATRFFFFASGLAVSSWAPMVPFAKNRLDLDEALLGLVLLAFGIGALIMMPITGWLVHRYGSRKSCLAGAFFLPFVLPLLVLAPSALLLSFTLFCFGCILGVMNVSMNAQAILVETKTQLPLMSGFHCLFSLGGLTGAAAISLLLNNGFDLLSAATIIAFLIALAMITHFKHLLNEERTTDTTQSIPFNFPSPSVLLLGTLCLISFLAEGAMLDWSAVYLRTNLNYEVTIAGIGYAAFSVAMAIGRWIGDRLIQQFGAPLIVQSGGFIAACGLLIVLYLHWFQLELFGFFLIGLGASNIVPVLFSAAGRANDTSSSFALTIVTTFGYTGLLVGPAIIGFLAEATTLSTALTGVAFLLGIIGLTARTALCHQQVFDVHQNSEIV